MVFLVRVVVVKINRKIAWYNLVQISGHRTFEHEFVHVLEKTVNQKNASNIYCVLIGQFYSTST